MVKEEEEPAEHSAEIRGGQNCKGRQAWNVMSLVAKNHSVHGENSLTPCVSPAQPAELMDMFAFSPMC